MVEEGGDQWFWTRKHLYQHIEWNFLYCPGAGDQDLKLKKRDNRYLMFQKWLKQQLEVRQLFKAYWEMVKMATIDQELSPLWDLSIYLQVRVKEKHA